MRNALTDAQLDVQERIERMRAENNQRDHENLMLAFRLDHSRDRHVGGRVEGCPACAEHVIPSVMPLDAPTPRPGGPLEVSPRRTGIEQFQAEDR